MNIGFYILENPEGRFYIGSTSDLERRFLQHNAGKKIKTKFTHKHGPWVIVWKESFTSRSEAIKRERQIKSMKSARWIRENLLKEKSI